MFPRSAGRVEHGGSQRSSQPESWRCLGNLLGLEVGLRDDRRTHRDDEKKEQEQDHANGGFTLHRGSPDAYRKSAHETLYSGSGRSCQEGGGRRRRGPASLACARPAASALPAPLRGDPVGRSVEPRAANSRDRCRAGVPARGRREGGMGVSSVVECATVAWLNGGSGSKP